MYISQLYLSFINKYTRIPVDKKTIEDFVREYPKITNSSNDLDFLKDYILSKGTKEPPRMRMNNGHLSSEAFLKAIQICQGYHSVKIAINFNPEATCVTQNYALVILEGNAGLIQHLIKEGFSLDLKSWGLIVSKL